MRQNAILAFINEIAPQHQTSFTLYGVGLTSLICGQGIFFSHTDALAPAGTLLGKILTSFNY
ncbi:MAG: hypothetical protein A2745_01245 [Candidatus Harrisonbacteria bacterium RIFCSPHIGHO2_01_FULL_44_13]|uniref:Uncharacterized protein n=1 Tax=Candidatus Harrisonbacteria bacterium RIFCSPLOWO2_01_FULL_44_18 TaxID=1798407 RepID=A0A1G1ZMD1_9BACT|nr:MAG: hypothetical protein A2745_01245 [Candidatus Harrisonbacteria bacterium RIFCSPHIGHO2_01_FULL_44_13]OGY65711.1 MAG: hypothetical protein A3A16_03795 [Candidatus Harrisonbacteria bacterium RIFCSPLOWO2_01_FULL_44_18]